MDAADRLIKAGLAINRLNLNSARLVYCEHFTESDVSSYNVNDKNSREAIIREVSPQNSDPKDTGQNKVDCCSRWNFSKHSHDFLELIYFIDGQANIKGEKTEYLVSPFDIVIYPEGIIHQEMLTLYKHQDIICIGVQFSNKSNIETILSIKDHQNKLKWIFNEIHAQHKSERCNIDVVNSLIKLLFSYVQQFMEKGSDTPMNRVEQAICYIRENFNTPITIEELANFVHVSPTFLNKLFKKATGTTPISYVNQVRIEIAKHLFMTPDSTVYSVCEKVGIEDPKYFSRLFKKVEGVTPSEYRNQTMPKFMFESDRQTAEVQAG